MHESDSYSDTYLAILEEGQMMGARECLLIIGEVRFGPPDESVRAQVAALPQDLPRTERMIRRAAKATSWQEILETP